MSVRAALVAMGCLLTMRTEAAHSCIGRRFRRPQPRACVRSNEPPISMEEFIRPWHLRQDAADVEGPLTMRSANAQPFDEALTASPTPAAQSADASLATFNKQHAATVAAVLWVGGVAFLLGGGLLMFGTAVLLLGAGFVLLPIDDVPLLGDLTSRTLRQADDRLLCDKQEAPPLETLAPRARGRARSGGTRQMGQQVVTETTGRQRGRARNSGLR